MLSQYQKSADVNIGAGMVVVGLASVIIGEAIIGKRSVILGIFSVIVGSVAYQIIIAIALKVNLLPAYGLKLISALIVAISLALPVARAEIKKVRRSKNV
jgi:putative ABC transport system permease protein